jgi:hypothetical protein
MENYDVILKYVDTYLCSVALHSFKQSKVGTYYKILHSLAVKEINNSHTAALYWSNVLSKVNMKQT